MNTKINLGCGTKLLPNCDNIDIIPYTKDIIVLDLLNLNCWKELKTDQYKHIYAYHFLEHIPEIFVNDIQTDIMIEILNQIRRISKDRAQFYIRVPYPSINALTYLPHYRVINWKTFKDFNWLILKEYKIIHQFKFWKITDYHFRKYLKWEIGRKKEIQMTYRINKW